MPSTGWRRPPPDGEEHVGGRGGAVRMIALATCVGVASVTAARDSGGSEVPLTDSLADAREAAARTGRPIVVIFGAVWCPVCRDLWDGTLRAPDVTAFANAVRARARRHAGAQGGGGAEPRAAGGDPRRGAGAGRERIVGPRRFGRWVRPPRHHDHAPREPRHLDLLPARRLRTADAALAVAFPVATAGARPAGAVDTRTRPVGGADRGDVGERVGCRRGGVRSRCRRVRGLHARLREPPRHPRRRLRSVRHLPGRARRRGPRCVRRCRGR